MTEPTKPLLPLDGDSTEWWAKRQRQELAGWDFTEYGDPQNRTGTCFYCDRMYGCEC